MKNTERYKKFEEKVLKQLGNEDVRKDDEKVRQILLNYFSESEFTVYIFVYQYYTEGKKAVERKTEVGLVKQVVKKALNGLIAEFDKIKCLKNDSAEQREFGEVTYKCKYYDEEKCSLSLGKTIDIYHCSYRSNWYHVIRRIAKFYENLQSVSNYLNQIAKNQIQLKNVTENYIGDFRSFANEALNDADSKIAVANRKIENAEKKVREANEELERVKKKIKKVKKVDKNLIAVMSIFVAAIIAIFMSTNFFTAVAGQVFEHDRVSGLFPVLIISLVSFAVLNLIYFLFTYISAIVLEEESDLLRQMKRIICMVDICLLFMIIALFSGLIVFQLNL